MNKLSKTTDWQVVKKASDIAKQALHACITPAGVIAGPHHFVDLWARDSFFATSGFLTKNDFPAFKQTIDTFLQFQRKDGLIPYRVMRSHSRIGKYFGKPTYRKTLDANYYSHMSLGLVPDGGLTLLIASAMYVKRSTNTSWLSHVFAQLEQAMNWYANRFGDGLIQEWFQCEWADGVLKSGKTLYTNVLYLKALKDMVMLSHLAGRKNLEVLYAKRYHALFKTFHSEFWNGTYFSDWIDWTRQDYFASHANFLAIIYGLTTKNESRLILSYARKHCINTFTFHNTYPSYPFWRIPLIQILGGISEYHNRGILWLQPGITYAVALNSTGKHQEAKTWLVQLASHIVKYNEVYEVYESNSGAPVHRRLYKSEGPFAWSAGLFLWATHEIGRIA